ncbi:MAG: hypothetical protein RIF41_00880 [Polyangiaceae bacterium]
MSAVLFSGAVKEIGPQSKSGTLFTRRMRFHQSWYRAHVLDLEYGTGPYPTSAGYLGNMLRPEEAESGKNFLTPEIHALVNKRVRENPTKVDRFRVLHNMLSSQPMCFNIFGPLVNDAELATVLARALFGEQVRSVTRVVIEWAPEPAVDYLDDNTSFDAFIEYELAEGGLGFAGIETKLTEPFSQKLYDGPAYRRWMGTGSPWKDDATEFVAAVKHNQLWRNHLLVWSMLQRAGSPYREGRVVVVRHPLDTKCADIVGGYGALLRDEATFVDAPLDDLVAAWRAVMSDGGAWLEQFQHRYLELGESESAWRDYRAAR